MSLVTFRDVAEASSQTRSSRCGVPPLLLNIYICGTLPVAQLGFLIHEPLSGSFSLVTPHKSNSIFRGNTLAVTSGCW